MPLDKEQHRKLLAVLEDVVHERYKQHAKWGEQNWPTANPKVALKEPDERCVLMNIPTEQEAKMFCEDLAQAKALTWFDIIIEELSESVSADKEHLREELVQLAAVVVAAIESLDRNTK